MNVQHQISPLDSFFFFIESYIKHTTSQPSLDNLTTWIEHGVCHCKRKK